MPPPMLPQTHSPPLGRQGDGEELKCLIPGPAVPLLGRRPVDDLPDVVHVRLLPILVLQVMSGSANSKYCRKGGGRRALTWR